MALVKQPAVVRGSSADDEDIAAPSDVEADMRAEAKMEALSQNRLLAPFVLCTI